jgi:hypothetical protein
MTEWSTTKVELLVNGDASCMDCNTIYWYCKTDENNIITEITKLFNDT